MALEDRRAQTVIPVSDLEQATKWYEGVLGFRAGQRFSGGVIYHAGEGSQFQLYETPNAGKNPATLMGFVTTDIEGDVRALKARGVVFEEYDMPGLKTVDSIADTDGARAAWFKDADGNILGLLQLPG
ncbi:VOC family protein [Bauldia sp.]|uniref:VOC family protein n=1 Tax=Bauldia sp. TaxID=2575872 RepID=UPI003BA88137